MNLTLLLSQLGLSAKASQDVMLFLVVIVASFAFMLLIGRNRLISTLVGLYVSLALLESVPSAWLDGFTYQAIFFLGCVVVLSISGKKMFDASISGAGKTFLVKMFFLSFLEVMLFLSALLKMASPKVVSAYVSQRALDYLTSEYALLAWMVLPLAFVFFIYRKK